MTLSHLERLPLSGNARKKTKVRIHNA